MWHLSLIDLGRCRSIRWNVPIKGTSESLRCGPDKLNWATPFVVDLAVGSPLRVVRREAKKYNNR